ncbi:MAG: glycosyltransferase, partial [Candidatus Rokuibacteriota bacterium]
VRGHAVEAGVSERVHVTGLLPRDEALALVKASDLFVFASQTETQGLVLAEALAAGLPVVAVAGPGVASTIRPGIDGELVPAEPAATLAERLGVVAGALAGDRRRRERMAAQAREGAARFDVRTRVAEVAGLYRELLAGRQ